MTATDPALGFVDGNYDEPEKTRLDRPFLNARQKYTHIVEDGLTQVTEGRIKCALDGGTFQIAMYDVTDDIVGAQRVFKEEITLPEEPKDGEDGYVVDTYTFDIGPVELTEYVGRELAVAVRHDRVRLRSMNWPTEHPDEYGWGCATGNRDGTLAETWQHDLQDGGSEISAALFVEPIESPAGKSRTVIGDTIHETRSQTVFAVFPGLSPEKGLIVEYDDRTDAGAPVSVLENGVLEVGQGSSEADSLDVWIRDTDDTWHGPKLLTLTEGAGQLSVTAGDETIAPGEQATLSLTADAVDRVTLRQLWADWGVKVIDDAGATTVQNNVDTAGELTLEWDSIQSSAAPSIAITPPDGTYVGGTYAIKVIADGDGDSATDTALVDIQSSSAGQAASTTETEASDTTTLVAARAPDGSRLTSRPGGPAYHTTDGTVHLFTWDEPGPGARAVLYDEDESTDWGGGPDIHVYDRMERPGAAAGEFPSRQATRGMWDRYSYGGDGGKDFPTLHPNSHSGQYSARVQHKDRSNKFRARFEPTTEVFLSYCVKIPEGKAMPGAEAPGEFPDPSVWKLAWLMHEETGGDVDIVLPAYSGGGNFNLHSNSFENFSVSGNSWWQWGEWIRLSFWLECGPEPESDPGRIRFQAVTEGEETRVLVDKTRPIMVGGQPPFTWKELDILGWARNKRVSGDNVEVLYDDIYLATGDDANARIELSDSIDYANSTRLQLCDIQSWSSNRVSARLRKGSLDSVESAAIHLTTADERQAVSMEVN